MDASQIAYGIASSLCVCPTTSKDLLGRTGRPRHTREGSATSVVPPASHHVTEILLHHLHKRHGHCGSSYPCLGFRLRILTSSCAPCSASSRVMDYRKSSVRTMAQSDKRGEGTLRTMDVMKQASDRARAQRKGEHDGYSTGMGESVSDSTDGMTCAVG